MNQDQLTILIPTKNRHVFLRRLLQYYSVFKVKYKFIIGDASLTTEEFDTNCHLSSNSGLMVLDTKRLNVNFPNLNIKYCHLPNMSVADTINHLNSMVNTEYVTLLPDDDTLIPSGIDACLKFLSEEDKYRNYISCTGDACIFDLIPTRLRDNYKRKIIRDLGDYPLKGYDDSIKEIRVNDFCKNYSVLIFGIHHISEWKRMWKASEGIKDVGFADEIIPCYMSAYLGRSKHLDCLYLVRQGHPESIKHKTQKELLTDPEWEKGYKRFKEIFTDSEFLLINFKKQILASLTHKPIKKIKIKWLSWLKIAYLNTKRKCSLPKLRKNMEFKILESLL